MKKFVMGLVFGLVLAMSFSVMANSKLIANIFDATIIVNNNKVGLSNKPVVINGSTYLPLREIAHVLNYNVQYEASSKTIRLDSKGGNNVTLPVEKPNQEQDNSNFMTLSELENHGFKFTFNNGLLIENSNGVTFQLSKNGYDKLINDGRVSILKNNVVFWLNYKNGDITIEDKILEAFK